MSDNRRPGLQMLEKIGLGMEDGRYVAVMICEIETLIIETLIDDLPSDG